MNYLAFLSKKLRVAFDSFSAVRSAFTSPILRSWVQRKFLAAAPAFLLVLAVSAQAQTATVNWTDVHQVIDGFGASDAFFGSSMSSANQAFFFGTGSGQLGLSILRVAVPNNGGTSAAGNCSTVGTSCAGPVVGDMQAVIANGGRVYASPWSPPAAYTTNGNVDCSEGRETERFRVVTTLRMQPGWRTLFRASRLRVCRSMPCRFRTSQINARATTAKHGQRRISIPS